MELNLAPVSTKQPVLRVSAVNKGKLKGSWRKRRREEVIQRARQEKKLRPSKGAQRKSQALKTQADEFQSGIEKGISLNVTGVAEGGVNLNDKVLKLSNSKNSDTERLRGLPNVIFEDGKGNARDVEQKSKTVAKKPRSLIPANANIVNETDQRPEAVSAALDIVGRSAKKQCSAGGVERSTNGGAIGGDVEVGASVDTAEGNDTFGVSSFEDTGLYRSVAKHLVHRMDLKSPTKIQEEVLKVMLNIPGGKQSVDILVRSATGSGKTLAYLLPIAHYLLNRARRITREDGAMAVVVVPTRELADQVEEVAGVVFRPWHWIVVGSLRGGENKRREKARLRKGINVVVATPGRLLDHMRNTRCFTYKFCEFLVLDEADRLLDLGFEGEIKEAIENLNNQASFRSSTELKVRSNILLSATLRGDVKKLAEFSLQDPVEVSVDRTGEKSGNAFDMPLQLRQHFCIVEQRHRLVTLACFLRLRALKDVEEGAILSGDDHTLAPPCKIIVFFSTCDSVDFHYELLRKANVPNELRRATGIQNLPERMVPLSILRIHGNHEQSDRVDSLRRFRRSKRAVLLCTDVAARGLDLKGLTFAIQYDPPTGGQGEELEYLHRAGRTARIGAQGDALLFLLPSERAYVGKLETKGVSIAEISGSAAMAALYPRVDLTKQESISYGTRLVTSALQESFENIVKEDAELKRQAVAGFQAYCRAYATHARDMRYFFHVRNLHLGHAARAFVLGDKPAELSQMIADIKAAKREVDQGDGVRTGREEKETNKKVDIARAIAEGERQPYNNQRTELARRRRERGRGQESFRELAMEFGA